MTLKRKRPLDLRSSAPSPPLTTSTVVPMDQDPEPERRSESPKQAPPGFAYIPSPLPPRIITPDPDETVSLFGDESYQDFLDYDGPQTTADWYAICGTEPYVHFELYAYAAIDSPLAATSDCTGLSNYDSVLLNKFSCTCPMASCTKCRGLEM